MASIPWRPNYNDGPLDHRPPDLARYVRRLRREQPEKYELDSDNDDMLLEDLDDLAAGSELGARLRQHVVAWLDAQPDWIREPGLLRLLVTEPRGRA